MPPRFKRASSSSTSWLSSTPLSKVAEWILVDLQVLAEMAAALPPLALEHGGRVLLDVMELGVDAPVGV